VREIVIKAAENERAEKRALAESIRARASAPGADFAAIAEDVSEAGTKKAGGLLGTVKKGDLATALDVIVFTLPVGEISPVLEADYGFHILKVDSRTDESLRPFEAVQSEIETKIRNERFASEYQAYIQKAWNEDYDLDIPQVPGSTVHPLAYELRSCRRAGSKRYERLQAQLSAAKLTLNL
jgi:peptidyl-prolyl cis-trans isomerase D